MKINPINLRWRAPTENVDGTPIVGELSYTLGVFDGVADYTEVVSFPGALNPGGEYEAPFADMPALEGQVTLALKAFYVNKPELESVWSNSIDAVFGVTAPNPPFGLAVS